MMPHWKDTEAYNKWAAECRAFGKAIWDIVGERSNPRIVFEHPGEDTVPTSIFVCDTGGMVVICAGTTGYNAVADLRYLWMRQKRLQGSHFANDEQSYAFNQLVLDGKIDPCLAKTYTFDEIPECHQMMHENRAPRRQDGRPGRRAEGRNEGSPALTISLLNFGPLPLWEGVRGQVAEDLPQTVAIPRTMFGTVCHACRSITIGPLPWSRSIR